MPTEHNSSFEKPVFEDNAELQNSWENPVPDSGGNIGAFRKTTDGQWVHVFCAEWVLESTFRKVRPS